MTGAFHPGNERASLASGTLYAVDGGEGWIYLGQVSSDRSVGFFRTRTAAAQVPDFDPKLTTMTRISVGVSSIGRALRNGHWKKLGKTSLHPELIAAQPLALWPEGTLEVSAFRMGIEFRTLVHDPEVQDLEVMGVWDAEFHVPARLKVDFGAEPGEWHVGGPIWRERRVKEEMARRFPEMPGHQLPPDWVPTAALPPLTKV